MDTTHLSSTVTVAYESFLYHEVPLLSCRPSVNSSSLVLQTSTNQYLIHPGHPDPQLLSVREVSCIIVIICRGRVGEGGDRGEGWELYSCVCVGVSVFSFLFLYVFLCR